MRHEILFKRYYEEQDPDKRAEMLTLLTSTDYWEDNANATFHMVCKQSNSMVLTETLAKDPHVNVNCQIEKSPLHIAVEDHNYRLLKFLLSLPQIKPNAFDLEQGWTPLHVATDLEYINCIDLLLDHPNINVNAQTLDEEGYTALQIALIHHQSLETIKTFLNHPRLLINLQNHSGDTTLHIACRFYTEAIPLILSVPEVDINVINDEHETPLLTLAKSMHDVSEYLPLFLRYENLETNIVSYNHIRGTALHSLFHGKTRFSNLHAIFELIERTDLSITDGHQLTPLGEFINRNDISLNIFKDDPLFIAYLRHLTYLTCPMNKLLGVICYPDVNEYYLRALHWFRTAITLAACIKKKKKNCAVSFLNADLVRMLMSCIGRVKTKNKPMHIVFSVIATEQLMALHAIPPPH